MVMHGFGAHIINAGGVGGVTISNATFDGNTLTNLYVQSNGAIKATSIQANLSGNHGAELDKSHQSFLPGCDPCQRYFLG